MSIKRCSSTAGFTLIEFLTVVAVIGVLAAILLPLLARVREKGRQAVCQSNLRQIGLAMQQYVQDYNGRYPRGYPALRGGQYWHQAIFPYTKSWQVFLCPTEAGFHSPSTRFSGFGGRGDRGATYLYSNRVEFIVVSTSPLRLRMGSGVHESIVKDPAATILNWDRPGVTDWGNWVDVDVPTACNSLGHIKVPTLHSGGANYSFFDGHVKWLKPERAAEAMCASDLTP